MSFRKNFNVKKQNSQDNYPVNYNHNMSLEQSLESIMNSEASISKCASKLFLSIFPSDIDSVDDIEKKINLFTTLLLSYNNRSSSLGKLIKSVVNTDDASTSNLNEYLFDFKDSIQTDFNLKEFENSDDYCTNPIDDSELFTIDSNPKYTIKFNDNLSPNHSYAKHILNGIYFINKIRVIYSNTHIQMFFNVYYNSKNSKLLFEKSQNNSSFTHTYTIN